MYPVFTKILLNALLDEFNVTVGGIDQKGHVINNEQGFWLKNQDTQGFMQSGIECALDLFFQEHPYKSYNVRYENQGLPDETAFIVFCG